MPITDTEGQPLTEGDVVEIVSTSKNGAAKRDIGEVGEITHVASVSSSGKPARRVWIRVGPSENIPAHGSDVRRLDW